MSYRILIASAMTAAALVTAEATFAQIYFADNFENASDPTTFLGNVTPSDPNGDADPGPPQVGFWDIVTETQPWKIQVTQGMTGGGPANPGPGPASGTYALGMERFFPSVAEIRGGFEEPATGLISAEFDLWINYGEAQVLFRDAIGPDYSAMPFYVDFLATGQVRVIGALSAPFFVRDSGGPTPEPSTIDYNHVKFEIDLPAQNFSIFVDGQTLPSLQDIPFPTDNPNVEPVSQLQQFAFGEPTGDGVFYVDNMIVQVADISVPDADYNDDGVVDAADYVAWRKTDIGGPQGYNDWVAHFGETVPGSGSGLSTVTAPEPANLALLLIGIGAVWCFGRRS